jgi:hypothetical protein
VDEEEEEVGFPHEVAVASVVDVEVLHREEEDIEEALQAIVEEDIRHIRWEGSSGSGYSGNNVIGKHTGAKWRIH